MIDISDFQGKILIFAGDDDKMWHSDSMGQKIKDMNPSNVEFHLYENVGHIFADYTYYKGISFGGDRQANLQAQADSDNKLIEFLQLNHTKNN